MNFDNNGLLVGIDLQHANRVTEIESISHLPSEAEALGELDVLLATRIKAAESGDVVNKSARQIFEEAFNAL